MFFDSVNTESENETDFCESFASIVDKSALVYLHTNGFAHFSYLFWKLSFIKIIGYPFLSVYQLTPNKIKIPISHFF